MNSPLQWCTMQVRGGIRSMIACKMCPTTWCFYIEIVSNMLWTTSALVNVQPPSSLSTLCSRPRLEMFFTMTMIWWWWQWYDDGHHWSCKKFYNLDDIDDGNDVDNGNGDWWHSVANLKKRDETVRISSWSTTRVWPFQKTSFGD